MGYSTSSSSTAQGQQPTPAWNLPDSDSSSDKMEGSTAMTEESDHSCNTGERHEAENDHDDDTTTIRSLDSALIGGFAEYSASSIPMLWSAVDHGNNQQRPVSHGVMVGSPSTVSTAPGGTDEASSALIGFDQQQQLHRLQNLHHDALLERIPLAGVNESSTAHVHRRLPSWEASPSIPGQLTPRHHPLENIDHPDYTQYHYHSQQPKHQHQKPQPSWVQSSMGLHHPQQRLGFARGETPYQGSYSSVVSNDSQWVQQQQQQQHRYTTEQSLPPHPPSRSTNGIDSRLYRPTGQHQIQTSFHPFNVAQQSQQQRSPRNINISTSVSAQSKGGAIRGPRLPVAPTSPMRTNNTNGSTSAASSSSGAASLSSATGLGSRSSGEILKTLLRKKACLYEPDTSRAVALVTWLVGRHLALEYGFFSRQLLQAGVHSCVAAKIEAGVITRTKVNRCMQIILNSCFHYIIPRPDGTEESGDQFRVLFANEVQDDDFLLQVLPDPWQNIVVTRQLVLDGAMEVMPNVPTIPKGAPRISGSPMSPTETPPSSPRLTAWSSGEVSPGGGLNDSTDLDSLEGKRAVLLCFNENVRSAEDVFRCHNEFIRDTAHASNLQLPAHEWRHFFGIEASSAPYIWGNVGIPVPFLNPNESTIDAISPSSSSQVEDALGAMLPHELGVFRTTWCAKRYDHNHGLCGFAHCEVNGGWLRRDPGLYTYKDELCPSVKQFQIDSKLLILNECPKGVTCEYAHSTEEIIYHQGRYKTRRCSSLSPRPGSSGSSPCLAVEICPNFHPVDSYRFPRKSEGRSPRNARQASQNTTVGSHKPGSHHSYQHHQQGGTLMSTSPIAVGSPILYASPAPLSNFERQLAAPGLQNLFRRLCEVTRAHLRNGEGTTCSYSYFGDDTGIMNATTTATKATVSSTMILPPSA